MNFQGLEHIRKYDFYLDVAFRKAKDRVELGRDKKAKSRLDKSKFLETLRLQNVEGTIQKHMQKIMISFPSIDDLPEFYVQMIKITIDYKELKKAFRREARKWHPDLNKNDLKRRSAGFLFLRLA